MEFDTKSLEKTVFARRMSEVVAWSLHLLTDANILENNAWNTNVQNSSVYAS